MHQSLSPHGPRPQPRPRVNPRRHASRCAVCRHPNRQIIEDDFLHWANPYEIAFDNHLKDRSSIYRHARAFGLLDLRRQNILSSLERLIERGDHATITAHAVIRAIQLVVKLTGMDKSQSASPEKSNSSAHPPTSPLWPQPDLPVPLDPLPTQPKKDEPGFKEVHINLEDDLDGVDFIDDDDDQEDVEEDGEDDEDAQAEEGTEEIGAQDESEKSEDADAIQARESKDISLPADRETLQNLDLIRSAVACQIEEALNYGSLVIVPRRDSATSQSAAEPGDRIKCELSLGDPIEAANPASADPKVHYDIWLKPPQWQRGRLAESPQPSEAEITESKDSKGDD